MDKALSFKVGADIEELKSKMSEAQGSMHGFKEEIGKIGATIVAAFAVEKIIEFGKASVEEAAKAIDGENRLLVALKGRKDLQEDLMNQAEELSHTTLFDDDEIVKQQALLAAMGRNNDQIKSIVHAATDMSAALGPDVGLGQVVEALNKALSGNTKALFALDPSLKNVTSLQRGHADAVAYVTEKYAGFAEQLTKTGSGPMAQFMKQWEDVKKDLGRQILPQINELLNNFSDQLVVWADKNTPLWKKILYGKEGYSELRDEIDKRAKMQKELEGWNKEMTVLQNMVSGKLLPDIDITAKRIETIRTLQEKINDLKQDEVDASGQELSNIQKQIEAMEAKLVLLKNQYGFERDAAQTAQLNKGILPGAPKVTSPHPQLVAIDNDLTGDINPNVAIPKLKNLKLQTDENTISVEKMANAYQRFGQISGDAIAGAISGHQSFGEALLAQIPNIISALEGLAMAEILASANNPSSNEGNYYVAVALMAAGAAIVSAAFAGLGGNSHPNVSSSGAGGGGDVSWTSGKVITNTLGDRVILDVNFQPINGTTLQAIIVNQQRRDNKVTGG